MSSSRAILSNTFIQVFAKILSIGAALVTVKILTGFGKEFYGDYLTAYEFLAFFGIIADAGLFAIAVRDMSKHPEKQEKIFGNMLSLRLLLVVSIMLLAGMVGQFIPQYSPLLKAGIWITALSMGLTILAKTLSAPLQVKMKIHSFAYGVILSKLLIAGGILFLGTYMVDKGLSWLFFAFLWAGVCANFVFLLFVWWNVHQDFRVRFLWDFIWIKNVIKESIPHGLALILQTLYLRLDVLLISTMLGSAAVGIYGVSTRVLESVLAIGVFFGQSMLPKLSEKGDAKKSVLLGWGIQILFFLSLPVILGGTLFAKDIVLELSSGEFLSSGSFIGADTILKIHLPTIFFAYLNQLFIITLISKKRQSYLFFVNLLGVTFNGVTNVLLLPEYGIFAAAITTLISEILVFGLLLKEILAHHTIAFNKKHIFTLLGANIGLLCMFYLTPLKNHFILAGLFGAAFYLAVFWFFDRSFFSFFSEDSNDASQPR